MPDEKTNSNHELIENYDDVTWLYNWWPMVKSNFRNLLNWVTAHINGTGDRHNAADIDYNSGTVEDGLTTLAAAIETGFSELADADAENCKYTIHQSYDVDISKIGSGNNVLYITIEGVTSYSQMSGKAVAINTGIYQCTFSSPSPVYVNVNGLGNKALRRPLPYDYADYDTKQYYTDKYCYGEIGRRQTLIVYYDGSNFILTNVAVPTKATKAIELESTDDSSYTTPKAVGVIAGKVKDDIGDLSELNTTDKTDIVGAINSVLSFATSGVDEDELLAALSIEFFNPNAYSIGLANLTKTGNKTYKADVTLSGAYIDNKIMNESKDYGMNKTYKDFHFSVNDLDRCGLWIDIDMLQNRSEVCQLFEFDLGDGSEPAEGYLDAGQYFQFHLCDFEIYDGDTDNPNYTVYNGYTSGVINMFEVVGGYLNSKAEIDHASSYTGYGLGDDVNYGHVKLNDSVNSTNDASDGTAATPSAVKAAYDLANSKASVSSALIPYADIYVDNVHISGRDDNYVTLECDNIDGILYTDANDIGIGADFRIKEQIESVSSNAIPTVEITKNGDESIIDASIGLYKRDGSEYPGTTELGDVDPAQIAPIVFIKYVASDGDGGIYTLRQSVSKEGTPYTNVLITQYLYAAESTVSASNSNENIYKRCANYAMYGDVSGDLLEKAWSLANEKNYPGYVLSSSTTQVGTFNAKPILRVPVNITNAKTNSYVTLSGTSMYFDIDGYFGSKGIGGANYKVFSVNIVCNDAGDNYCYTPLYMNMKAAYFADAEHPQCYQQINSFGGSIIGYIDVVDMS